MIKKKEGHENHIHEGRVFSSPFLFLSLTISFVNNRYDISEVFVSLNVESANNCCLWENKKIKAMNKNARGWEYAKMGEKGPKSKLKMDNIYVYQEGLLPFKKGLFSGKKRRRRGGGGRNGCGFIISSPKALTAQLIRWLAGGEYLVMRRSWSSWWISSPHTGRWWWGYHC